MMVNLLMYHAGMDNLAQQVYYYAILERILYSYSPEMGHLFIKSKMEAIKKKLANEHKIF